MTTIVTRAGKGTSLSWNEVDANFNNLNTNKAETYSPTFTGTVSGITKTMVGLGNVDNTSDLNKPISTATQSSLDLKISKDSNTGAANIPSGTTAQRPSIGAGKVRFNSTLNVYEGYNTGTSSWEPLGNVVNTQTLGLYTTTAENHFWDGSVANQLSLKRGTPAAPGAELIKTQDGVVSFPSGILNGVKAWCKFNGTLTGTNTPTDGYNIASINRLATGHYRVTFQTALSSGNYAVNISVGTAPAFVSMFNDGVSPVAPTTTTFEFVVVNAAGASLIDCVVGTITVVGA